MRRCYLTLLLLLCTCNIHGASKMRANEIRAFVYANSGKPFLSDSKCISAASSLYKVDEFIVLATLLLERGDRERLNRNHNGTVDHGKGQINTVRAGEIARFNWSLEYLAHADCPNIIATTYLLSEEIKAAPDVWTGAANYHYDISGKFPKHHHKRKKDLVNTYYALFSVVK